MIPAIVLILDYIRFLFKDDTKNVGQGSYKTSMHIFYTMNIIGFFSSTIFHIFMPYSPIIMRLLNM